MDINELRSEITAKTEELGQKIEARDVEGAKALKEEIRQAKELLKLAEEKENEERAELENQKGNEERGNKNMDKVNEFRAVVKHVMGKETTAEERANINSVDNGAVIPKQFVNQLIEIQKGYGSLRELCDIIPVTKNEGTIPVVNLDQNELADIGEGEDIVDGTLVTDDISFKCAKVGLIQTLNSETVDDAEVEMESLVKKNFANIATVKENSKILKVIKDNATVITDATSYEDLEKAIDSALPSVKSGLTTFTNVSGYVLLKNMKDSQKRPLNLITEVNGVEYFHSKPIVTVEDEMLPATEGKNVFYIANIKEAVKYCDRKVVTVARSTEAGFNDDTIKLRILERFIPIPGSTRSIKKIEF
ncbi:phage major capsid protein [Ruminiclostridium cellobioparum]|uniref:Phage major capsid protein, HK97 family n=1 Tax=Ruminiclostridium cellobioparum subsp. termitidis CT1112 TaxID=1195236 RepID=S0FQ82_RUMCE|nr:phage major capsid protein [Ruminiclostridium cellobioparum]EMS74022.1 phage major capsid protein, HK97 family [Ruminiclostridium cellobioparum subsp. termitidis CT1112]